MLALARLIGLATLILSSERFAAGVVLVLPPVLLFCGSMHASEGERKTDDVCVLDVNVNM